MSSVHSRIIAAAARAELAPLGFEQKGRSRLWLADRGSWLNIVEFTPSAWSKAASLTNAAHFLWQGNGFLSFDKTLVRTRHAYFEAEDQFELAVSEMARTARTQAQALDDQFPSFDAIAKIVIADARRSPDRADQSWAGYRAGVASGLIGNLADAASFLHGLSDDRVITFAKPLLPLLCDVDAFRSKVSEFVAQGRSRLALPPLDGLPFQRAQTGTPLT